MFIHTLIKKKWKTPAIYYPDRNLMGTAWEHPVINSGLVNLLFSKQLFRSLYRLDDSRLMNALTGARPYFKQVHFIPGNTFLTQAG